MPERSTALAPEELSARWLRDSFDCFPSGKSWMRSAFMAFMASVLAVGLASAQNLSGTWHLTAASHVGSLRFSATIQIAEAAPNISGEFTFAGNPCVKLAAFKGTVQPPFISPTGTTYINLKYDSGVPVGFVADISPDGNSLSGEYGVDGGDCTGVSRDRGVWVAFRAINPMVITGITNAASGLTGPISPGELISIYANAADNAIGPPFGIGTQLDQGGNVTKSLGGVQVLFLPGAAYALLSYVSAGQINAVVPYEVADVANLRVAILYGSQSSKSFAIQAARAAPGMFTSDGTGSGQGAIRNGDGTRNGPFTPERQGGRWCCS